MTVPGKQSATISATCIGGSVSVTWLNQVRTMTAFTTFCRELTLH